MAWFGFWMFASVVAVLYALEEWFFSDINLPPNREEAEGEEEFDVEKEILRNNLDAALSMLADWAVSVRRGEVDAEHDCYLQTAFKDGPLRTLLDEAIRQSEERRL